MAQRDFVFSFTYPQGVDTDFCFLGGERGTLQRIASGYPRCPAYGTILAAITWDSGTGWLVLGGVYVCTMHLLPLEFKPEVIL